MQILASHLTNVAIVTYRDGQLLGYLGDPIVDMDRLEVAAFYCRLQQTEFTSPVILFRDICEFGQGMVVIGSEEDIDDASEIVRISKLTSSPFLPIGKTVVGQSGQRLGRVVDYTIQVTSYEIGKLYVKRPWPNLALSGNAIIDRTQLIEVLPKKFVVRDPSVRAGAAVAARLNTPSMPE